MTNISESLVQRVLFVLDLISFLGKACFLLQGMILYEYIFKKA